MCVFVCVCVSERVNECDQCFGFNIIVLFRTIIRNTFTSMLLCQQSKKLSHEMSDANNNDSIEATKHFKEREINN